MTAAADVDLPDWVGISEYPDSDLGAYSWCCRCQTTWHGAEDWQVAAASIDEHTRECAALPLWCSWTWVGDDIRIECGACGHTQRGLPDKVTAARAAWDHVPNCNCP